MAMGMAGGENPKEGSAITVDEGRERGKVKENRDEREGEP